MNRTLIASAIIGSVLLTAVLVPEQKLDIDTKLHGKTRDEVVSIKSKEIFDNAKKGKFKKNNMEIEIVNIEQIDGGVQVFAKAWKNGNPVGFGADGSVEIERFRIFNPPLLVDDPNGTITRTITAPDGRILVRTLREDPYEALKQVLKHNISLIGKEGTNIFPGKVGNTTDTYYPDPNVEVTSVDGYIENYADPGTCTTMQAQANGTTANDAGTNVIAQYSDNGTDCNIQRGITLFDSSSIPDTDTVSSAVLSLRGLFIGNTNSYNTRIVTSAPASNTALAIGDYSTLGTTSLANEIAVGSFSTTGYNDYTLTDLTKVSKTGVSKLGFRLTGDISAASPTGANYAQAASADTAGTTSDPKLVVVHAASAAPARPKMIIID